MVFSHIITSLILSYILGNYKSNVLYFAFAFKISVSLQFNIPVYCLLYLIFQRTFRSTPKVTEKEGVCDFSM